MSTTQPSSSTPILDLREPLPRPAYERRSSGLLHLFLALGLFAMATGNLAVPFLFLWITLIWWIGTFLHECGHLFAGWLAGMRFESVSIGSLRLVREAPGLRIRFARHQLLGQASMSLDRLRRVRRKLILCTAGGPAATLLSALTVLGVVITFGSRLGGFAPGLFDLSVYVFVLCSFFTFLVGLRPARYGTFPNDALILKTLLTCKSEAKRLIASHALQLQLRKGVDPVNLNRRWRALACPSGDGGEATYEEDWRKYESAMSAKSDLAAVYLESCLAASAILHPEQRDHLICEAAFFNAKEKQNAVNAEKWFTVISSPGKVHALSVLRVQSAIQFAKHNYSEAAAKCEEALRFLENFPPGAPARDHLPSWRDWRREIEPHLKQASGV
jgi:hypothetical protein